MVPRIPKKFFKNPVPQHGRVEDQLRKELCIKEVEHEIKRLKAMADIKLKYVQKIDEEMCDLINSKYSDEEAELQKLEWKRLTESEEKTSHEIWKKKSEFFSSDKHLLSLESRSKPFRRDVNNRSIQNFIPREYVTQRPQFRQNPNSNFPSNRPNQSGYRPNRFFSQNFIPSGYQNNFRNRFQTSRINRNNWDNSNIDSMNTNDEGEDLQPLRTYTQNNHQLIENSNSFLG